MMESIWLLTKKNLQLLLRSRSSALVLIFAPLLLILVLALTYNSQGNYNVNIGVYTPVFSAETDSIIGALQAQNYTVVKYNESIDTCVADIKAGFSHACLSIPVSLVLEDNTQKEIVIYVDPSRQQLVYALEDVLKSTVRGRSSEISEGVSTAILAKLKTIQDNIAARKAELVAIKGKTSTATTNAQSAKTGLQGIDLTPTGGTYNQSVIDATILQLNSTKTILSLAVLQLNNSNISAADKLVLDSYLLNTSVAIDAASGMILGGNGTTITALLGQVQTDLGAANAKLGAAQSGVSASSTSLDSTSSSLQESITSLDALSTNLDAVVKVITDQKVTDPKVISAPLTTRVENVSPKATYLSYLFPGILILVVMFGSLLLGTTLVMIEKNSPAFVRNFFVPIPKFMFVLATYLTNLILIVSQIVIILIIASVFLPEQVATFPLIALVLFLTASIFTFLGMIVGYIFASEETAVLGSISVGTLFLTVSGVILPIEAISRGVQEIMFYNPFVVSERIIRQVFLFGSGFGDVVLDLAILAGYMLVLFFLILLLETLLHRHLVERFMRGHHKGGGPHKASVGKSEF